MVKTAASLDAETVVVPTGRARSPRSTLWTMRRLGAAMRSWKPDVVVSWMSKAQLYAGPPAWLLGLPALWFQHGYPSARDPIDRVANLLPAREILTPSSAVATAQASLWPSRRTRVVHPGVELASLSASVPRGDRSALSALDIPASAPVVGIVARLQRWKGIDTVLEAHARLVQSHPDAHLVVVGGEHPLEQGYADELRAAAARLGIAPNTHFVGYQSNPDQWMRAFDVVVHASDNEPFGLVILEAMALGRPLIAGLHGGPAEIVRDGKDGYLVGFGDAETLADRIETYLDHPELAERSARSAFGRVQDFSAQRFAGEIEAALRIHASSGRS